MRRAPAWASDAFPHGPRGVQQTAPHVAARPKHGRTAGRGLARAPYGVPCRHVFQPAGGQRTTGHTQHGAQKKGPQRAKVQPPKTWDSFLRSEDFVDGTKSRILGRGGNTGGPRSHPGVSMAGMDGEPCDHRGRDGSDEATSQGRSAATRGGRGRDLEGLRPPEGAGPCRLLVFGLETLAWDFWPPKLSEDTSMV